MRTLEIKGCGRRRCNFEQHNFRRQEWRLVMKDQTKTLTDTNSTETRLEPSRYGTRRVFTREDGPFGTRASNDALSTSQLENRHRAGDWYRRRSYMVFIRCNTYSIGEIYVQIAPMNILPSTGTEKTRGLDFRTSHAYKQFMLALRKWSLCTDVTSESPVAGDSGIQ